MSARYLSSALEMRKTEFCGFAYMPGDWDKKHREEDCWKNQEFPPNPNRFIKKFVIKQLKSKLNLDCPADISHYILNTWMAECSWKYLQIPKKQEINSQVVLVCIGHYHFHQFTIFAV